jgi:hypothetical protein
MTIFFKRKSIIYFEKREGQKEGNREGHIYALKNDRTSSLKFGVAVML